MQPCQVAVGHCGAGGGGGGAHRAVAARRAHKAGGVTLGSVVARQTLALGMRKGGIIALANNPKRMLLTFLDLMRHIILSL